MEVNARKANKAIVNIQPKNYQEFDFFQLVRVLQNENKKIQFNANQNLTFPAADIENLESHKEKNKLLLNFMGLIGVDSPLPQYFTKLYLQNDHQSKAFRDFIGIFENRIYELYYQAWQKYQSLVQLEAHDDNHIHYLTSLSSNTLTPTSNFFEFTGIFGARVHNATSLCSMLKSYLNQKVTIQQFIPKSFQIPVSSLGDKTNPMTLGDNVIIGNHVSDNSSALHISIGPVELDTALEFLPEKNQGQQLNKIIQQYLSIDYQYKISLEIIVQSHTGFTLGKDKTRLGIMGWLGEVKDYSYEIGI